MPLAKWIIINNERASDKEVSALCYSVLENGRDVEVLYMDEAEEFLKNKDETKQCIVPSGSIWFNRNFKVQRPNFIGSWHNHPAYLCHNYYGYLGKHISQQNYLMMPFGEILRRRDFLYSYFNSDSVFFRPDSGEKEFTGELVHKDRFQSWVDVKVKSDKANKDLMCVVSAPLKIKKELRLLMKKGKVITGSTYKVDKHIEYINLDLQDDKNEIIEFAESLSAFEMPLPPVHLFDIALTDSGYSIMEVGCNCCCGRYDMDMIKFTKAISEAAEEEFEK